jgi:hypothetical protein
MAMVCVILVLACLYGVTPGERSVWLGGSIGATLVVCGFRCTPNLLLAEIAGNHPTTWGDVISAAGPRCVSTAMVVLTLALVARIAVMFVWSVAPYKRY